MFQKNMECFAVGKKNEGGVLHGDFTGVLGAEPLGEGVAEDTAGSEPKASDRGGWSAGGDFPPPSAKRQNVARNDRKYFGGGFILIITRTE